MNKTPRKDETDSADERAAKIDRLARPIIEAAQKRETVRRRHIENEMEKLKRVLNDDPDAPLTGSKPPKGTP